MTTYEEEVAEVYFNLQNYFTMKNIPFPAIIKRPGGKGRGEIDILAIKFENRTLTDAIYAEVTVSVTGFFPFKGHKNHKGPDDYLKLIKKFWTNDAEYKIYQILGNQVFRRMFIVGSMGDLTRLNIALQERINYWNQNGAGTGILQSIHEINLGYKINLDYNGVVKEVLLISIYTILDEICALFQQKGLEYQNFEDPRLRGLQYLTKLCDKKILRENT